MSYRHSIIKTQRHSSKGTVITSYKKSLQIPICMNISSKPSPSSIPRKSTLLKSSDVCILCRTNTRHACMVSDGSGLHARRVLKHCPSVSSRSRSRPQVGPFTNVMFIPPNIGQTRQGYHHEPTCPARGVPPRLSRICSQNIFQ